MAFEKGRMYSRQEIAAELGGGVQDYMPQKDGRIVCLCLSQGYEPSERQAALVGAGPGVQQQAEMFCAQAAAVPVFFKEKGHLWEYAGDFSCERWTDDPETIAEYEESSGRHNLTRVIYLKQA
ncbi:MAG: hypothetical protein ACM3OC_08630 [Deltaproteobacteria bacterium]